MPLGNGDVGLNVWVERDGDLLFYLSKSDAWSETARLLKLGRVRVALSPNPFAGLQPFRQTLDLLNGEIVIQAGRPEAEATLRIWADANWPVVRVEVASPRIVPGGGPSGDGAGSWRAAALERRLRPAATCCSVS
jgi:hypothetical protein